MKSVKSHILHFLMRFMGAAMLEKLFNQEDLLELPLSYAQPSLMHAKTVWGVWYMCPRKIGLITKG